MPDPETPHLDGLPTLSDRPGGAVPKPIPILWDRTAEDREHVRAWEACKRAVDVRDKYRCRCCGRRTVRTLTLCPERAEHHHLVGRWFAALVADVRNVLLVCALCHGKITRNEITITGTEHFELDGDSYLNADCPLVFVKG